MRKKLRNLLVVIVITCIALAYVFHLDQYLTLESIKANRAYLKDLVDRNYYRSVVIFMFAYIALTAFSIPTGGILTLTSGFLFGVLPATVYVCVGATIGAACAFLLTRYLVGQTIPQRYPRYARKMDHEISRYGYSYLLMLRLVTVVPFFLVNIIAGTTSVSFFTFLWTTMVGIIPATMIFAFAGQELGTISSVNDIFSKGMLAALLMLAFFALMPMLLKRFRKKRVL